MNILQLHHFAFIVLMSSATILFLLDSFFFETESMFFYIIGILACAGVLYYKTHKLKEKFE